MRSTANPMLRIFVTLLANVGLTFFVLASTGPLIQAWFARAFPTHSPYPLYAASNLGSLLALLSFPLWMEPTLALSGAGRLWSWLFGEWGVSILVCSGWALRAARSGCLGAGRHRNV